MNATLYSRIALLPMLSLALYLTRSAGAYPGDPDPGFSQQGTFDGQIYAVAVDSHTNIWVGGGFTRAYGHPVPGLAVLRPDGSWNYEFDPTIITRGIGAVYAIALDGGDNVYFGGQNGVGHLNYLGPGNGWAFDDYFSGNASQHISNVRSIALRLINGSFNVLWAAGNTSYTDARGVLQRYSACFDANGMLVASYGPPANLAGQFINQFRYVPAGSAIVNGTPVSSSEHLLAAGAFGAGVWDISGSPLSTYSTAATYGTATCVAERPFSASAACASSHGDLVAGGAFEAGFNGQSDSWLSFWLERFGGADSSSYFHDISTSHYPADQGSGVTAIEALEGGDLLVSGYMTTIHNSPVGHFVHLLPDGSVDSQFRNTAGFPVLAMARQPDGKIVLVGMSNYTPITGQITRRQAMDAPRPVTFTASPSPVTVYPGDTACFQAAVDAWPPPSLVWLKNSVAQTNQTSASFCLYNVSQADAGDYQLRAAVFCGGADHYDSAAAHLTVLPPPPPPSNDQFANATVLSGKSAQGAGTLRGSSLEASEPDPTENANGHSVWWSWTAPASGIVSLDISGSDLPTLSLAVYTGNSPASLSEVADNCDRICSDGCYCAGLLSQISFQAVQGTTYHIAIGGTPADGSPGNILLNLQMPTTAWASVNSGTPSDLYGVDIGQGHSVIVGDSGTILTSTDATRWTQVGADAAQGASLYSVTYGKHLFVAVGDSGTILTSIDATNWTQQATDLEAGYFLNAVGYGKGLFAAVGSFGLVITSPDGTNWTEQVPPQDTDLYALAFGSGQFVAAGDYGTIRTSPDGTNWTTQATGFPDLSIYALASGGGLFVAGTWDGETLVSTDATNWTSESPTAANGNSINGLAFGQNHFLAVGDSGALLLSTDGANWFADYSGSEQILSAAAYFQNGQFLAVGDSGTILLSRPPQLDSPILSGKGTLQFNLVGLSGTTAIIEAADRLSAPNWRPLFTNTVINGTLSVKDATTNSARFYRARVQ